MDHGVRKQRRNDQREERDNTPTFFMSDNSLNEKKIENFISAISVGLTECSTIYLL